MPSSETLNNISDNSNILNRYGLDDLMPFMQQSPAVIPKSDISCEQLSPATADSIAKHCSFIQSFRDDAEKLGYQHWFAGISNLALCVDGKEKIHEWSSSYANYSYEDTQKLIDSAREHNAPATCEYIRNTVGFSGCRSCPVKSPISWGSSNLGRAIDEVDNYFENHAKDKSLSLHELPHDVTTALTTICLQDFNLFEEKLAMISSLKLKLNTTALKSRIKSLADAERQRQEDQMTLMRSANLSRELGYTPTIPSGFALTDTGIEKVSKDKRTLILPKLVLPCKRYSYPGNELIGLKYQRAQNYSSIIVPRTLLASSSKIVELSSHGIPIDTSTALSSVPFFTKFLLENETSIPTLSATPHLGWQGDGSFLPGLSSIRLVKTGDEIDSTDTLQSKGSLEEWTETMRPLRHYMGSRLAMAASMAGPLLYLLGVRTFIVHLWGPSQGGKTASQKAALSLWLNPASATGNIVSFNATRVALEVTLGYLKNLPFMINERQQVGNEQGFIDQLVYMLGEGQGRSRGSKNGGLRNISTWQTTIITSGEHPLTSASSSEGERTRTLEIFAENFIGDCLLASQMHSLSERYYGTAGVAVLEYAIANQDSLKHELETFKASIIASHPQLPGSYYDYISVLALSEKLLSHLIYGHTIEEAHQLAEELISHTVSSLPSTVPEWRQAYMYLQNWVNQHMDQFDNDAIRHAGWIKENDVFFLPLAFDTALYEGRFHPDRVRRDFAAQNLLQRGINGFTVTRKDPNTKRMTRVILLPNFLITDNNQNSSADL